MGGQTLHFGVLASQLEKDLKVVIADGSFILILDYLAPHDANMTS